MAWAVVIAPAVKRDIADAYDWYKTRSPKAAQAFRAEVLAAFELISQNPLKWAEWESPVRRLVLKQYPYTVYFEANATEVRILAVGHHRRQANYWKP